MGLNLNAIAAGVVKEVNPATPAVVYVSSGPSVGSGGVITPMFMPPVEAMASVQALSYRDLTMVDSLNLQGVRRAIYLNGEVDGLVRATGKGGDVILIPVGVSAGAWLVAMVLEQWPQWVKCACTLQNGAGWLPPFGANWVPPWYAP